MEVFNGVKGLVGGTSPEAAEYYSRIFTELKVKFS